MDENMDEEELARLVASISYEEYMYRIVSRIDPEVSMEEVLKMLKIAEDCV